MNLPAGPRAAPGVQHGSSPRRTPGSRICRVLTPALVATLVACAAREPHPGGAAPGPARIVDAPSTSDPVDAPSTSDPVDAPSTFSIVAHDPETGEVGVAVASKFPAVGSVVPWAEVGAGAIATQAYANTSYGPRGLALLREGLPASEVVRRLLADDPEREFRQVAVVDARGGAAAHTGGGCLPWAGSRPGDGFSVQGNILVSERTLVAMAETFRGARGELADRLLSALEAGDAAGGDARGRQSAALLVQRKGQGYGGFNDRYVDLRVDDHGRPVRELRRLLEIQLGRDPLSRARRADHQGRPDEALAILEEALREHPGWEALVFQRAEIRLGHGDAEGGARDLAALASRPGADADLHYRAARLLAEAGLEAPSRAHLETALASNPEYRELLRREAEAPGGPFRKVRGMVTAILLPASGPR